jgi:LDH2 family malate/lactate/ureidoglycolate dehydrogenase
MPDETPAAAPAFAAEPGPKPKKVLVGADDLRSLVAAIFRARGSSPESAATVADALVWANLRGVDSHGVSRVPRYIELFDKGESVAYAEPSVTCPRSAIAIVDAHAAPGPVALAAAARAAIDGAREAGVGWATVRGTVHTGAIGYYTSLIAREGFAAIGVVAGVPNMAYEGARGPAVATSPLSVAVPAGKHEQVVLDMATAVIALGKIAQLKAAGAALPEGAALTADGSPTTDPALAKIPAPMGGAKGAGMSLVFELLASGLAANPIVPAYHSGTKEGRRHRQNAFILAVDISAFVPLPEFTASVDATVDAIKSLPPSAPDREILVPGERGRRTHAHRLATGIPLGPKPWHDLTAIATSLNIPIPDPLA